ncbi:MAG: hypothetical protein U0324_44415, partial [Polyangiales bacterium]
QVHESPRRPSAVRPGVPRALDALALKLLAKDRDARPRDARAVLDALDQWEKRPVRRRLVALGAVVMVGAAAFALRPTARPTASVRDAGVRDTGGGMVVRDASVAAVEARDASVEAAPDAVREVVATLVVEPEGARVTADGEEVVVRSGVALVRAPRGAVVRLRAEAPGRVAREQAVALVDDVALRWTLAEAPRAGGEGPRVAVRRAVDAGREDASAVEAVPTRVLPDGLHASPYDAGRP